MRVWIIAVLLVLLRIPAGESNVVLHPPPQLHQRLTTYTIVNDTRLALPVGTPITMGQAFRYGDIMPGTYPQIRDASTHQTLQGQQWDEIDTFTENGGNGSWRHAVWAINLPVSVPTGGTYQIEFVPIPGTYSQTSHQTLTALCAAHDFKTHFIDVRNQDDSPRDSGDATFRLCDNIANTGRDAPRHLRAGNVYDEYEVSGLPVYTSGHKDPLLYVQCVVDLFTDPVDGTSLKDVRHVCTHHNGWMNVAAGSTGNAGNVGPAGFSQTTGGGAAGDPQAISYQPQMLDGSTNILDWTNLNATVASANSPINPTGCNTPNGSFQGQLSMNIPTSTGNNIWFEGMAVRVSTTGGAVGGLTSGKLYWVYNCGSAGTGGVDSQDVQLMNIPTVYQQFGTVLTNSQGSGTTTFTQVFWHPHWSSWQDEDSSADQSWATAGSTQRFTRRIYPAFTLAEKSYWEETGLIEPVNLSQTPSVPIPWSNNATLLYAPFSKGNVIGTTAAGERPDLGFATEWSNQAFISETQNNWFLSRLYAMGSQTNGWSVVLDEATGRIPVINNGPPTGLAGNGVGGSYGSGTNSAISLGSPQNQTSLNAGNFNGVVSPNQNVPNGSVDWRCNWAACGTFVTHVPNFVSYNYWFFGERLYLDSLYFAANRDLLQLAPGPGSGEGSARDNVLTIANPAGTFHWWGNGIACCQGRGSAWSLRDRTFAAASGGDGNIERSYFNDQVTENMSYYAAWLQYKEGLTGAGQLSNTTVTTSQLPPDYPGTWSTPDTQVGAYIFSASYGLTTYLHASDPAQWVTPFQRYYEQECGLSTNPPPFYCIDSTLSVAIANGNTFSQTGGLSASINGVDATNNGNQQNGTNLTSGGVWQYATAGYYTFTNGDTAQLMNGLFYNGRLIDQLPGNRQFTLMSVNNSNSTFKLQCTSADHTAFPTQCPTAGQAFTGYTRSGAPITPETQDLFSYRLQHNSTAGYVFNNYAKYGGTVMNGLKVMGYDAPDARSVFQTQGGNSLYSAAFPGWNWESDVVVPGIDYVPLLSFSTLYPNPACTATPGTALSTVSVTGGNGNPITLSISDPGGNNYVLDGTTPPSHVIVAPSGPGSCSTTDVVSVTASQAGSGFVIRSNAVVSAPDPSGQSAKSATILGSVAHDLRIVGTTWCGDGVCETNTPGPTTVTDGTNNCSPLTNAVLLQANVEGQLWACPNITGSASATVTATWPNTNFDTAVFVAEFGGGAASPDAGLGATSAGVSTAASVSPSGSAPQAGALVVALFLADSTTVFVPGAGMTELGNQSTSGGFVQYLLEAQIPSRVGQIPPSTATLGASDRWFGVTAVLLHP